MPGEVSPADLRVPVLVSTEVQEILARRVPLWTYWLIVEWCFTGDVAEAHLLATGVLEALRIRLVAANIDPSQPVNLFALRSQITVTEARLALDSLLTAPRLSGDSPSST